MASKSTDGNKVAKKNTGFFKSVIAELKKVHWPTKKEVLKYTGVVVATCVVAAVVLGLFDLVFGEIFALILG